jgi:hypothetical protein
MFAVDRPHGAKRGSSCKHTTATCRKYCFNNKLMAMYTDAMTRRDIANEESWQNMDGQALSDALDRKRNQTDRFRLMTRGEAFSSLRSGDLERVIDIPDSNPDRVFWIPTRAWRRPMLRRAIEALREICPNVRILASTDPETTKEEQAQLDADGWSTMFFGDDSEAAKRETLTGNPRYLCPKTWGMGRSGTKEDRKTGKGACGDSSRCNVGGCFDSSQPVHIHLKTH